MAEPTMNQNRFFFLQARVVTLFFVFLWLSSCSADSAELNPKAQEKSPTVELRENLGSGVIMPVQGDQNWQLYRNPGLGFEIAYPKTLIVHSQEGGGQAVLFFGRIDSIENFGGWVSIYQPIGESWVRKPGTLEEWYTRHEKVEAGQLKLSEEKIVVNGLTAIKVVYRN